MQIICRIKKALEIHSPAPYQYCDLGLNAPNKKRCKKCKHFDNIKYAANTYTESVKKMAETINKFAYELNKSFRKGDQK